MHDVDLKILFEKSKHDRTLTLTLNKGKTSQGKTNQSKTTREGKARKKRQENLLFRGIQQKGHGTQDDCEREEDRLIEGRYNQTRMA